jgi:GT2 family glycosyltransferase
VRTLRCLAAQTYPAELIEIVIADDGSEHPIAVPEGLAHDVRVVRQERTAGFGAGRARNLAGAAASGDILFFLDADVLPERQVVESYARWFDRCDLAAPLGLCRFVDVDDLTDDALVGLVESGGMEQHFAGLDVDDQTWRERHFERLDDLRIESIDAFRVAIGATLAVSATQFHDVGGFPELGVRGVEDTAFGYRIHNNGGVLILDRDAVHWHQGRRNLSTGRRQEIDRVRAPYVESVIPVRGFRRGSRRPTRRCRRCRSPGCTSVATIRTQRRLGGASSRWRRPTSPSPNGHREPGRGSTSTTMRSCRSSYHQGPCGAGARSTWSSISSPITPSAWCVPSTTTAQLSTSSAPVPSGGRSNSSPTTIRSPLHHGCSGSGGSTSAPSRSRAASRRPPTTTISRIRRSATVSA